MPALINDLALPAPSATPPNQPRPSSSRHLSTPARSQSRSPSPFLRASSSGRMQPHSPADPGPSRSAGSTNMTPALGDFTPISSMGSPVRRDDTPRASARGRSGTGATPADEELAAMLGRSPAAASLKAASSRPSSRNPSPSRPPHPSKRSSLPAASVLGGIGLGLDSGPRPTSARKESSRRGPAATPAAASDPSGSPATPTGTPAPRAPQQASDSTPRQGAAATAARPAMPRQRTEADERARAAAREAERLNWERTRGAGSDVMKLKEEGGEREGEWQESDVLPTLEQCESYRSEPVEVPSADVLLSCGVSDYTVLPRILGRGKFSTVFMASKNGELSAIKHTALFPHHQLISTRLLREPTLLAELPPHPNLVAVQETVRTPGHFYLVEEYLGGYVTLEALVGQLSQAPADAPATLPFDVASCVLDQLISAVQAIHVPLQICHRDIKPENILVHPDSLQLKLLDFGLATHYSKSEPKLSTCCGSPAFHCPEIVRALASPPGAVSYWGPEVDAWTVGVTMLRCLTGARFPLGSSHSSLRSMAIRAQRAVATIADPALRERVGALLDMDGTRRMRRFSEMAAANETQHGEANRGNKAFKSTTFIPVEPTHTMKLPVLVGPAAERAVVSPGAMTPGQSRHATPQGSRAGSPIATPRPEPYTEPSSPGAPAPIVLLNPTMQPPQRLLSFMKYCFRCAGILYHAWPDPPVGGGDGYWQRALSESVGELPLASPTTPLFPVFGTAERPDGYAHVHIFECVIELPEEQPPEESGFSLVQSIMAAFGRRPTNKRSLSTPAKPRVTERDAAKAPGTPTAARATPGASGKEGEIRCLRFYVIARFPKLPSGGMGAVSRPPFSRQASQATFGRRSRASSAAGSAAAAGGLPSAPASGNSSGTESPTARKVSLDVDDAGHPRDGTPRGTRDATPKGVRDGSRARSGILRSVSSPHLLPADAELSIETQVALPPATGRSPSSSRAASRTRKASRASRSRKSKVFIQVTDERAVEFVRKALSVGGTSETSDADEPDELASLLREAGEPGNPQRSDQTRRRPGAANRSRSRASIATLTSQDPATPTASRPGTVRSPSLAGFPFPTRDDEQESRGRRGRDAANGPRGGRAPSMLSSTTLHEEAVTPRDDLRQTLDVLAASLRPLTRSSDMPLRQGSASSGSSAAASPGEAHSSEPSPALSAGGVSSASPSPAPSPGDTPSSEASSNAGRSSDGAYQQVRTLLAGLSQRLAAAEQSGASALEDMISPVVFALFSSLSPALGLEDREVADLPRVSSAVAEDTTLSGLASSALQVVARHASPRELYIAAQERLEMLADQSRRDGGAVARGGIWCAALEVAGIVSFLAAVIPRIRTQKPHNFVDPLLSLLPRVLRSTVADTGSGGTTRTEAAVAIMTAVCRLTSQAAQWEKTALGSGKAGDAATPQKSPSDSLLALLFTCLILLADDLPTHDHAAPQHTLAELHFRAAQPQFVLPGDAPRVSDELRVQSGSARINAAEVWTALEEARRTLELDLEVLAFAKQPPTLDAAEDDRRSSTVSLGAYLLLVQLEARAPRAPCAAEQAELRLRESLPLVHACLGTGASGAVAGPSKTGSPELSPSAARPVSLLADSAQLWLMWCLEALDGRQLGDELLLPLVHAVSAHAALSPRPTARHISFRLLRRLIASAPSDAGLDLVRDLVGESPYPQLRVAVLGLVRELAEEHLDGKASAGGSDLAPGEAPKPHAFASPRLLAALQPIVFVLPDAEHAGAQPPAAYLSDHAAWLIEACNLLYFLLLRDAANQTSIRSPDVASAVAASLVAPLRTLLAGAGEPAEPAVATQIHCVQLALERVERAL